MDKSVTFYEFLCLAEANIAKRLCRRKPINFLRAMQFIMIVLPYDEDSVSPLLSLRTQFNFKGITLFGPRYMDYFPSISGIEHAQLTGLEAMPVIIWEPDDDAATLMSVDLNLHRDEVLPCKRASAYQETDIPTRQSSLCLAGVSAEIGVLGALLPEKRGTIFAILDIQWISG